MDVKHIFYWYAAKSRSKLCNNFFNQSKGLQAYSKNHHQSVSRILKQKKKQLQEVKFAIVHYIVLKECQFILQTTMNLFQEFLHKRSFNTLRWTTTALRTN